MPGSPAFHRENQARRDIADVDEIHDEIEIQVQTSAKKMPKHRGRRSEIVVMRSDWHRRCADDQRKTR